MHLDVLNSIPCHPTRSAVDALAGASTPPSDRATCRGVEPCSPSALSFVDTWVSAPVRTVTPRDFTFKAVVGEVPF